MRTRANTCELQLLLRPAPRKQCIQESTARWRACHPADQIWLGNIYLSRRTAIAAFPNHPRIMSLRTSLTIRQPIIENENNLKILAANIDFEQHAPSHREGAGPSSSSGARGTRKTFDKSGRAFNDLGFL
jgi:hypothetical protein